MVVCVEGHSVDVVSGVVGYEGVFHVPDLAHVHGLCPCCGNVVERAGEETLHGFCVVVLVTDCVSVYGWYGNHEVRYCSHHHIIL